MNPPPVVLCRCLTCCCKPGEGHNDPRWIAYEAALDECEDELRASAARVDPPPVRCDLANDIHITPHQGCVLR